jgi:hypothetical protein
VFQVNLTVCPSHGFVTASGCFLYGRVESEDGIPVPFASIFIVGVERNGKADQFGRFLVGTRKGTVTQIEVSAEGFNSLRTTLRCPETASAIEQQLVKLQRLRPKNSKSP